MAESGLSVTRTNLRNLVGFSAGIGADFNNFSANHLTQVDLCIDSGLRSFYDPPPIPGEKISHVWSFMTPVESLSLAEGVADYELPDDFGGFIGDLYFSENDQTWGKVHRTNISRILAMRSSTGSTASAPPSHAAEHTLPTDGSTPTRYQLSLFPTPNGNYTLKYQYRSNPYQLSATAAYPLGGQPHAETLRASCVAAWERDIEGKIGVHAATFMSRLTASVNLDRNLNGTKHFGKNTDRRKRFLNYGELRHPSTQLVDYGGIIPD